uniref:Uncharacterized protein n=1 Tax=Knipowitschia caucasica TaxID=637954 RepID=A0AAV2JDC9_KNICA
MFLVKDGNGNFGSDRDALPAGGRTLRWKSSSRRKVATGTEIKRSLLGGGLARWLVSRWKFAKSGGRI